VILDPDTEHPLLFGANSISNGETFTVNLYSITKASWPFHDLECPCLLLGTRITAIFKELTEEEVNHLFALLGSQLSAIFSSSEKQPYLSKLQSFSAKKFQESRLALEGYLNREWDSFKVEKYLIGYPVDATFVPEDKDWEQWEDRILKAMNQREKEEKAKEKK
jgi:hypothetical protein